MQTTSAPIRSLPPLFERMRIVPIRPRGDAHAAAFDDLVSGLSGALRRLGCRVDVVANEPCGEGVGLIVGAHLLDARVELPSSAVILNLEQAEMLERKPDYVGRLGRHAVLDYSMRNVAWIREATGNEHVHALGIGYGPELARIVPAPVQDIDVLFYGSINSRRQRVLAALEDAGLKVKALFGAYAQERDRWIARSKLVLNLHFYGSKVHEIVRTSYLLANRKAVVCECDDDTEIAPELREAMACVPYDRLVEACLRLASDDDGRRRLEQRGFEVFSRRDQRLMLVEALPKLARPLPRRINLGSGKDWREDALNVDVDARTNPDVVCDLAAPGALAQVHFSRRFGLLRLEAGGFHAIETNDVLEHVPDLVGLMTRCLDLLEVGGEMRNSVPYDLSYGAWQDPTHVRAFNERSWLYYTDWHWYLGWREARFDLAQLEMSLSPLGRDLRATGEQDEVIFRTPRAVDSMRVVLTKRLLDDGERQQATAWYGRGSESRANPSTSKQEQSMRICLNMIVKNEAHVIERCLRSVLPYIDAWAIADTGSTDGTQDVIRSVLGHLPGELIERPWVDFAHNRNEALQLARRYGDYALVIDADDVFEADPGFSWGGLDAPGYMLQIVFGEYNVWWRVALMRLGMDWCWEGVIHEVPNSEHLPQVWQLKLHGARIRIVGGGARSRLSLEQKLAKDIDVMRRALVDHPDNPRYTFYLAQALRDAGQLPEALEAYQRRVDIGGWFEEVYHSKLQVAWLKEQLGYGYADVVAAYVDAFDYRPQRAEAPCELARYLRIKERYAAAFAFARIASALEQPPDDLLMVDMSVYCWRARDELALALYFLGDHAGCAQVCDELLADPRLPPNERERIGENRKAVLEEMRSAAEPAAEPALSA